ncbi:MAG TPA: hypothetical protein VG454_00165, partial [Gemmatimonadales bacterium]|nr:hypothetical protein [Gemmatimonadales bacterium]
MSSASASSIRDRAALLLAAAVAVNSIITLVGWSAGWPAFVRPSPSFIPMAPTTALAFLALSFALATRGLPARWIVLRISGTVATWIVATMAIVNVITPSILDRALGGASGQFGPVPLGVMSTVTAAALLLLAPSIAAAGARRSYAGPLATVAAIIGGTVALGYAYGAPLLYGSSTIPVSLPTALSLLLLG